MNKQQQKQQRLLKLTAVLLKSRRPMTAEELRYEIDDEAYSFQNSKAAFRRTFERDKKDLLAIGVPIVVKKWKYGDPSVDSYFIDVDVYSERDLKFKVDELAALHLATRLVRLSGTEKVFLKTGVPSEDEVDDIDPETDVSTLTTLGEVTFHSAISQLAAAAARKRSVNFNYQRIHQTNTTPREVEPWYLVFDQGRWYLIGWDRHRCAERMYRLDRISGSVKEGDEATFSGQQTTYTRSMKPWLYGTEEPVEVKVLVDAQYADWAASRAGTTGEVQSDGSSVLTLQVNNLPAFRSFVLRMLDHAEVLSPKEIRDDMVRWLKDLV